MKKYSFFFLALFALSFFSARAQHVPIITTIAGNGTKGYSGDGGPATDAQLNDVDAVAVDDSGNVYITDVNYVIRKVNTVGVISTFAGTRGVTGFSGDNGPATAAKLGGEGFVAFDKKGNVYFTDGGNYRLRKIDKMGIITTVAGNGSFTDSGDGGPATAAELAGPFAICIDTIGNIYITTNRRIRKIDTAGIIIAYGGTGVAGITGNGGPATAAKMYANGEIVTDATGNLYFADNYYIRKIDRFDIITVVAGNGTAGNSGDGGPATAAQFDPRGIYVDKCGNIYIADINNNCIRMVNTSGIISTIAGTTVAGYKGDGDAATAAEFYYPAYIYLDGQSSIYIADGSNYAVRYIHMDSCRNTLASPQPSPKVERELSVYPNPNTGTFMVNFSSPVNEQVVVCVMNMMGMKVREFTAVSNREQEVQLNVPAGVYFLSVSSTGGRYVQKVVVE